MPLVEVIRGKASSPQALARTIAFAQSLGKKAIVVGDCPGFLVNRVLFAYFTGFAQLLLDGANYEQVDRVMEAWGWPMGPAYLSDVIGLDTCVHAEDVIAAGYPDRMQLDEHSAVRVLFAAGHYGQKTQHGFYAYGVDKKARLIKQKSDISEALLRAHCASTPRVFSDQEIIERTMIPMATELSRCLETGIVDNPAEADLALVFGLGFPPFRGGIFRWLDQLGLKAFFDMTQTYQALGKLYQPSDEMQNRLHSGQPYYA